MTNLSRDVEKSVKYAHDRIKVSVVIPCYNHGKFLKGAVQSVLRSRFTKYEIIVVNDGSTADLTLDILNEMEEKFQYDGTVNFMHQENSGLAAARNNGIKMSKGEYILPLDADNRIRPDYLTKAVDVLDRHPEVGVVYAYAQTFGDQDPYEKFFGNEKGLRRFQEFDGKRLLVNNFIDACSVLRKKVWEECNGYDGDMGVMGYEDWDLWIGAMEKGWKFHLIKEVLFEYYIDKNSMVSGCNIPENRRHLIKYICNKHRNSYIEHLEYVIAEKDVLKLLAENRELDYENVRSKLYPIIRSKQIFQYEGFLTLIRKIKAKLRCRMNM